MKRQKANEMLIARFEQLNKVAESIDGEKNLKELCDLCDSAHKMYITLSNAGAFEEEDQDEYTFGPGEEFRS